MHTLLVIDDDPLILKLLEVRLRHVGYEVVTAGSGPEALALDLGPLGAILCDFTMPGMTGLQVLEEVRARGLRTPFVIISATHEPEGVPAALTRHDAHFMMKPVDMPGLVELLERQGVPPSP